MATDHTQTPAWKSAFLTTCLDNDILKFGAFTLKSGRISPYFFNTALFHRADLVLALATAYAQALIAHDPALDFTVLFGPAYKGIPLATTVVTELARLSTARFRTVSFAFNRKEAKDHGEGGVIVGAALAGQRVVIIDDVVTAGTAKREAIALIRRAGGTVAGIAVALDRMEKLPADAARGEDDADGVPRESAIGALRRELGGEVPIISVLTLDDLVAGLKEKGLTGELGQVEEYRMKYRASD